MFTVLQRESIYVKVEDLSGDGEIVIATVYDDNTNLFISEFLASVVELYARVEHLHPILQQINCI